MSDGVARHDRGSGRAEPDPPAASSRMLGARAVRGTIWVFAGHSVGQLLRLGANLLLARLLFPEAFGLMALVSSLFGGLAMFSDVGLAPNVVQSRKGDEPAFLYTAWTIQILRGALLFGLTCLLAWPVAAFYDEPALGAILPVAGTALLLAGFNSTSLLRFRRHLRLDRLVLVQLAAQSVGIAVMIGWARVDPSVWALVGGGVAHSAALLTLSHLAWTGQRDRAGWDRNCARELFGFGKWIFLSTILTFLAGQADRVILGAFVSFGVLGLYSIGAMLSRFAVDVVARIGDAIVFPALSRHLDARGGLRPSYRRTRPPLLALNGFIAASAIAGGPPLIETLYDPRYAQAGWMLQLLAVGAWFQGLHVPIRAALLALGRPRWLALGNAAKLAVIAIAVPGGFSLFGLAGAIGGFVAGDAVRYLTFNLAARRVGIGTLGADLVLSLLVAASAALGLYAEAQVRAIGEPSVVRWLAAVVGVVACWLPVSAILLRRDIRRVASALGRRWAPRP